MKHALLALVFVLAGGFAAAHEYRKGDLLVFHPWTLPTEAGVHEAPVYLWIDNEGAQDDALLGASTPLTERVELREARSVDGARTTQAVTLAFVNARSTSEYSHDGVHLWLSGLKSPLVVGERVPLVLHFERAGPVEVEIGVQASPEPPRPPAAPDPHAGHAGHDHAGPSAEEPPRH